MRQGLEGELSALLNEILSMHKPDGPVFEKVYARVSLPRIFVADIQLPIEGGDRLTRPLPNGLKDEFIVDDRVYRSASGGVPDYFELTVHAVVDTPLTESSTETRQTAPRESRSPIPVSRLPPPPTTLGGISGPPAPILTIPTIEIDYPEDFPKPARRRIVRERLRAVEALAQKRGSIRSTEDLESALLKFTLQVFAAFAKETCDLGRRELWTAERCESECREVLLYCARVAFLTRDGRIPDDLQTKIERSDEWKEYWRLILEVADNQADNDQTDSITRGQVDPNPEANFREVAEIGERAARRQAVVNPVLKQRGWKPRRLVTEAGVGKNSVYKYLDGTRRTITKENREAIAAALNLNPEQLPD